MNDIAHHFDNQLMRGDLAYRDHLLAMDQGLTTAILHSLFSDARADCDELPAGAKQHRGWWGDCLASGNDRYGSKLWLLQREKRTRQTLQRAREYAHQALAWLVEDGHADKLRVETSWTPEGALALLVTLDTPAGVETISLDYPWRN